MSFLMLNGVTVPVLGHSKTPQRQGARTRADSGMVRNSVRSTCWDHTFQTAYLSATESRVLRMLIEGEGHVVSFADTRTPISYLWTSRGAVPSEVAGDVSRDAVSSGLLFGNNGGFVDWRIDPTPVGSTVISWISVDGDPFAQYVTRSDGKAWENGVLQAPGTAGYNIALMQSYLGDTLEIVGGGNGLPWIFKDVMALPYLVPESWVPQLYAYNAVAPWSPLPRIVMGGDCTSSTTGVAKCQGEVGEATSTTLASGVVAESFSFTLMQMPG